MNMRILLLAGSTALGLMAVAAPASAMPIAQIAPTVSSDVGVVPVYYRRFYRGGGYRRGYGYGRRYGYGGGYGYPVRRYYGGGPYYGGYGRGYGGGYGYGGPRIGFSFGGF